MKPAIVVHVIATADYNTTSLSNEWVRLERPAQLLLACDFESTSAGAISRVSNPSFPPEAHAVVFSTIPHHRARYAVLETIDEIASLVEARTLGER